MSSQQSLLMGLLTETSLHAGVGQNIDVIDLPIQREAHTGYPCVFGSAVKGALRAFAEDRKEPYITELFGANNGNEFAGALIITDARLLLLPVRSLTSHFKWVTCPAILKRLKADCERLGLKQEFTVPELDIKEKALVYQEDSDNLFLEEFHFETKEKEKELITIIETVAQFMGRDDALEMLKKQLVIINDDIFSQIVKSATPVNAHIAIDNETKTVIGGALWYEETLPPDTLLYVGVVANVSRKSKENKDSDGNICHLKSAEKIKGCFKKLFEEHSYLQLGGNETVGMGWCKVKFYPEQKS